MSGVTGAPLVVVGDALLDVDVHGRVDRVCPDAPAPVLDAEREHARPGGAALTALLAARTGRRPVTLVTALADADTDPDAARLLALLAGHVEVVALPATGSTPVKTRMLAGGRPLLRLDRGGLGDPDTSGAAGSRAADVIAAAGVLLVSDYGRGVAADPALRTALATAAQGTAPLVWDPHPRGATPLAGATAVTPNLAEARAAAGPADDPADSPADSPDGPDAEPTDPTARAAAAGRRLAQRWDAASVVVTVGEHGAVCARRDPAVPFTVPAAAPVPSATGDACGAGDRFAAALATALGDGADLADATATATAAAGAFVADGGAGAVRREPDGTWTVPGVTAAEDDPVEALLARVRARGGRVVATGGCFDLVHAGHARTLDAARELAGGDGAVVVCLNSDASVRRLKGPERPLVAAPERAELLRALRSVDAVVVFDEDDPCAVLDRLRPDLWVKGGDYAVDGLAETPLVRSWGGDVVTVAFHAGRSTTALAARLDPPGVAPTLGRPVLDTVGEPS